jgi:histidinol-phosphate aminotransferase
MYGIISQSLGVKHRGVPLDDEFDLDMDRMMEATRRLKPGIVFLSSPNNPTGNSFSEDRIIHIIRNAPGIVVVDEAYQQFSARPSFIPKLKRYRNLVVLRTLSKIGLAALRVGFMVADPALINEVNKVRLPFNVNALSQAAAVRTLEDRKRINEFIKKIRSERKRLMKEIKKIEGIKPYPSDANFILFRAADGASLHRRLLEKGVLVRNMSGTLKDCLRVTVGAPRENDLFLKMMNQLL